MWTQKIIQVALKIFEFYQKLLNLAPERWRTIAALVVLAIIGIGIWRFIRKNLFWIVVIILLLPGAWPSLKQVGHSLWQAIVKFFQ